MQQERFPLYLLYPASIETDTSYHCKRCVYKEKILGIAFSHEPGCNTSRVPPVLVDEACSISSVI